MQQTASNKTPVAVPLVDAVTKALEILDCFSPKETELSLNQLCEKTNLYKSRVHRLCGTLIKSGYLVRTSRTNYRLGPKVMVLGKVYEKTNSLNAIASPLMENLSSVTGESTALFAIDNLKCICMMRKMGTSNLVYSIHEGELMELHASAVGRVLLAYADEEFIDRVLSQTNLTRLTSKTLVDKEKIRKELQKIRQTGFALDIEGREEGITAIAAPVFDFEHKVPAALAIVGPSIRFTDEGLQQMLENLLETTSEMSRRVGEA